MRKPSLPLPQVIRRLSEGQSPQGHRPVNVVIAKKHHTYGPASRQFQAYLRYKELHLHDCYISFHQGDNCIMIGDNVALVRNILTQNEDTDKLVVYEKFGNMANFFTYSLQSVDLRVTKVSGPTVNLSVACVSSIVCKFVPLPFRRKYIAFPMIDKFKN